MGEKNLQTECFSVIQLDNYLNAKAVNHKCYKTYTRLNRIQSWINSDCFYLDDGSNWNDTHDRQTFNSDNASVKRFGRCFSFSKSESVAMWMLYGGMQKDGAMLEFSQKGMRQLLSTSNIEIGNWIDEKFVSVASLNRNQFKLELKDILYTGPSAKPSNGVYIRRSDEVYHNAPSSVIKQLGFCVKSIPWSYENECRLILTVKKSVLPSDQSVTSAKIPFNGLLSQEDYTSIYCAPNFRGEKPYNASKLSDEIDWNLCHGCKPTGE